MGTGHIAATAAAGRISGSAVLFGEILDFLTDEAALLDDDRHLEWLELLTADITYRIPVRKTLYRRDGRGDDACISHFDDDRQSLGLRVRRSVEIPSAFDRDPAPRIRRLVTNLAAYHTDNPNEFAALTYITLFRNRFDAPTYDVLTGKRHDVLRRTSQGLKLARRIVLLDQALLGAPYTNVFM